MVELSVKLQRYRCVQLVVILIILVIHVLFICTIYYTELVHSCGLHDLRNNATLDISPSSKKTPVHDESVTAHVITRPDASNNFDELYGSGIVTNRGDTSLYDEKSLFDTYEENKHDTKEESGNVTNQGETFLYGEEEYHTNDTYEENYFDTNEESGNVTNQGETSLYDEKSLYDTYEEKKLDTKEESGNVTNQGETFPYGDEEYYTNDTYEENHFDTNEESGIVFNPGESSPYDETSLYVKYEENHFDTNEEYNSISGYYIWIKLLSLVATAITTAVYIYLPELRTSLHGKIVLSTVIHSALPAAWGLMRYTPFNPYFELTIAFFIMIRYMWECIMNFEVWFRFSRPLKFARDSSQSSHPWRKFFIVCIIAWGYPIVFSGLEVIMDCKEDAYLPYALITLIWPLHVVLFVSTLLNVRLHLADSSAKEILRRHNAQANTSLSIYFTLALLTGIDSMMPILLMIVETSITHLITRIALHLRSVFLMTVLILNRRVIRMIIEKWRKKINVLIQPLLFYFEKQIHTDLHSENIP